MTILHKWKGSLILIKLLLHGSLHLIHNCLWLKQRPEEAPLNYVRGNDPIVNVLSLNQFLFQSVIKAILYVMQSMISR